MADVFKTNIALCMLTDDTVLKSIPLMLTLDATMSDKNNILDTNVLGFTNVSNSIGLVSVIIAPRSIADTCHIHAIVLVH